MTPEDERLYREYFGEETTTDEELRRLALEQIEQPDGLFLDDRLAEKVDAMIEQIQREQATID